MEHYDQLRGWALKFTDRDQSLSEDLLHDTFIHFTLSRPDLGSIDNLEGFLYVVMRNLHLSQMRKATRTPFRAMSVVDFDTVDVGVWASDPRDRLRFRDELAAVCQYACIRKETSKGGSVLIMRFFHGYYPEEIAKVLKSTRSVVHERLRLSRAEAKTYVEAPERTKFADGSKAKPVKFDSVAADTDLRIVLRQAIYSSMRGDHQPKPDLEELYKAENGDGPECQSLAHIVSCQDCLDNVNAMLDLPPLSQRYPLDSIGKDPGPKDRSGGGSEGGPGGSNVLDSFVSRRDAHYHHEPQELCISVNGQLQGFQKVVSGKGEFTLILEALASAGFVEVFSEQGLRLLLLNVDPPPSGDGKQTVRTGLSGGRSVDADLDFSGPVPALQIRYIDPEPVAAAENAIETTVAPSLEVGVSPSMGLDQPAKRSIGDIVRAFLQPVRLTAGFAVVLIAALIIFQLAPFTSVSASELLSKSVAAETAQLANKDRVLHRTIDFEELNATGEVISRKRIDVWQGGENGITARRLYDEQGRLTMGDWRSVNGIQTIYRRGEAADLRPLPEKRTIGFDDAWQLSLTAKEFIAILGQIEQAHLETRDSDYLISYTSPEEISSNGIAKATIVLGKEDLHAIEQSFTVRGNGETRDYRMTEAAYEWRPASSVAPAVFEPNLELTGEIGNSPASISRTDAQVPGSNSNTSTSLTEVPPAAIATAALEVEIVESLNNAGAFMGEQVGVQRTPDGRILVTAMVETVDRKNALLLALQRVSKDPAVKIRIETVAEAEVRVKRQTGRSDRSGTAGPIQQVEITEDQSPVFAELKKRLSDEEVRRFADRVLNRSRQGRQHALAAKQLAERFSPADLQSLSPSERSRWLALIRGHAEAFLREAESLKRELRPFFQGAETGSASGAAINSDSDLQRRTRELYDAAILLDRGFGRSFSLNAGGNASPPITSPGFWNHFANAAEIARSISLAK